MSSYFSLVQKKVSADLHKKRDLSIFPLLFQKPTGNSEHANLFAAFADMFDDINRVVEASEKRGKAKKLKSVASAHSVTEEEEEDDEDVEEIEDGKEDVDDVSLSASKPKKATQSHAGRATSNKSKHIIPPQSAGKGARGQSVVKEAEENSQADDEIEIAEDKGSLSGESGEDEGDENVSVHSSGSQKPRRSKVVQIVTLALKPIPTPQPKALKPIPTPQLKALKPIPTPQPKAAKSIPDINNNVDDGASIGGESIRSGRSATTSKASRKSRRSRKPTGPQSRPSTSAVKLAKSAHSSSPPSAKSGGRRAANPRRGQSVTAMKVLPQRTGAPTSLNGEKGHPTGSATVQNPISSKEKPAKYAQVKLTSAELAKVGKFNESEKKSRIQSWLKGIHRR